MLQVLAMRTLAHVQEARADGRVGPLMQAGAVVVAVEVGDLEREVAERVRAIDDHRDIARMGHLADPLHGKIWPVRLVMWQSRISFVAA